jgi:hypothetical protein
VFFHPELLGTNVTFMFNKNFVVMKNGQIPEVSMGRRNHKHNVLEVTIKL